MEEINLTENKELEIEENSQEEPLLDFLSNRLVELKNAEQKYLKDKEHAELSLDLAIRNLTANRARIDEIIGLINRENNKPKNKQNLNNNKG